MIRATLYIALWGAGATAVEAQEKMVFICTETAGGWCESDGTCYQNTKSPAEFVITMPRLPSDGEPTSGTLKECRDGKCGSAWDKQIVANLGNSYVVNGQGETFKIDGETGFFTQSMSQSGSTLGRVSHTFGYCKLPERK